MAEPILSTRDVAKVYAGFSALDGVTLDVAEGTVHAIIGPQNDYFSDAEVAGFFASEVAPEAPEITRAVEALLPS